MTRHINSSKTLAVAAICCLAALGHGAPTAFDTANGVPRGGMAGAKAGNATAFVNGVRVEGATPGEWTHDWDAATKAAKKDGKPIFINYTGSDWCGWCKLLKRQVFTQPEWSSWASNNVYLVHIDFPKDKELVPEKYRERNKDLSRRYKVNGYPTCYLLDSATLEPLGSFGASRDVTASAFVEKVSAAMPGAKSDTPAGMASGNRTGQGSTVTTKDFKAVLTGIAVVDDKYRYKHDNVAFVPPETKVVVPHGKTALFRVEYDFPEGYAARVWTRDGLCDDGKHHSMYFGSNPSGMFKGKGTAYGFLCLLPRGKRCRLRELLLKTGSTPELDHSPREWTIAAVPIDIEFLAMPSGATKTDPAAASSASRNSSTVAGGRTADDDDPVFEIGGGILLGVKESNAEIIKIPTGVKVVGLKKLRQARRMRVLNLPEGVERLERGGDWGYTPGNPLEQVCIPASVHTIAPGTFYGFKKLKTLEVAKGSPFSVENGCLVDKRDGTLLYALPTSATVVVPDGVKRILNYAFYGNDAVREVVLPNGVETIGPSAFSYCGALESISIPATIAEISDGAFSTCGKLSRIEVSPGNPRYGVRDGMLMDKKTSTIVRAFGQPVHVEIPADVENIGAGAFSSMQSITSVVVPDSVKRIESRAFAFCKQLENLRLPKRVDFCDGGIAEGCASLKSIKFPVGMGRFHGQDLSRCDSLVELVIPEGVKSLDGWWVIGCRNLLRLSLPASLRVTSGSAFGSIPKLEAIDIHPANPSFRSEGGVLFSKDMTRLIRCPETKKGVYDIPKTVKRIDGHAFANCRLLTEIRIPAGATEIGYGVFENCTAKTKRVNFAATAKVEKPVFEIRDGVIRRMSMTEAEEIEIPQGVKTVGTRSIQRKAWYMRTLVLPEGVESLERGDDWRYNPADPLEKIVIPASVQKIAPGTFYGFRNLASLEIAPGSPFVLAEGNLIDKRDGTLLYVLPVNKTVTVQSGVKRICDHAFAGNDAVREVILPEGVVAIGKYAFSACTSLETVRIPASIAEIGDGAFSNCGKLSQIEVSPDNPQYCVHDGMLLDKKTATVVRAFGQPIRLEIPADVENIAEGAFSSMKSVTFAVVPDSVKRIEKGAFSYCELLEELLLPKRVEFCDGGIVQGCVSLRAIEFPVGTVRFSGQDLSHCDSLAELAPPEGVTTLRGWKTIDCGNLSRLVLPASLKDTDGAAYGSIPKLGAIEVNPGNQSFRSEDGVLFSKDMTRLIRCPETKEGVYDVPETVKRIDGHAFANCSSLTDVRIPAGATNIGFGAFSDGPAKTNGVALAGQSPGSESKAGNNPLDKLPKAGRIAWFDFSKGNEDMARPNRSFVCRDVTFEDGAMHFNGIYHHRDGCNAELRVPELDRAGFTVGLWFRPDFNKGNSLPLLNFGHSYRWFYAHVGTGGRLFFGLNCHDIRLETKGVVTDQDWNWFVCSLDTAGKVLRCVLNGVRLADVPIPENFAYKDMPERYKDLVDTTYWNGGRAFKGSIRSFALFGRPLSEEELQRGGNRYEPDAKKMAQGTSNGKASPAVDATRETDVGGVHGMPVGKFPVDGLVAKFVFDDANMANDLAKKGRKFQVGGLPPRWNEFRPADYLVADGALQVNGEYKWESLPHLDAPELRYDRFSVAISFRPHAEGRRSMPLVSFGGGWRWFHVLLRANGTAEVSFRGLEKGELSFPLPEKIRPDDWNWMAVSFDDSGHRLSVVLNGQRLPVIALPSDFAFRISQEDRERSRNVQFANTNGGSVFKGEIGEFLLFDRALSDEELDAVAVPGK